MAARCLLFDGEHLLPPSGVNFTDKIMCVICGSVASIWPGGTIMAANKSTPVAVGRPFLTSKNAPFPLLDTDLMYPPISREAESLGEGFVLV